jgi:hypothetical protein
MTAFETVSDVLDVLNRLGVPHLLVGSFSVNLYAIPRMTKDVDFVLEIGPVSVQAIAAALGPGYALDPPITFETVTTTTRYRMVHRETDFALEFFKLSSDPHDRERFRRRVRHNLAGPHVDVPTPEDVVINKLRWSKGGHRRKDVEDVENVLAVQAGALDLAYIRQWADQHGTRELFERLLVSAAEVAGE